VRSADVRLVRGATSRTKLVDIAGFEATEAITDLQHRR
jgi:uncharacterized protein YggU (UPF0235/DUF167 family)